MTLTAAKRAGSPPVEVRAATSRDVPVLVDLMSAFYQEASHRLDKSNAADAFEGLLREPQLGGTWLAWVAEEVAGYIVLSVRFTMEHGALSGYVDDLYVAPRFRRTGCGRALMQRLFDDSRDRGCRSLQVEVGRDNAAALALYRGFGLEVPGDGRVLAAGRIE